MLVAKYEFYVILAPCHRRTSQRSASEQRPTVSSSAQRQLPAARSLRSADRKAERSSQSKYMLPKHSRLTKKAIEEHLIRARRLKTSGFLVLYTHIPLLKGPQISVTVSKKVAKTAVLRNKLRRRAYTAIRPLIPQISPTAAALVSYTVADLKKPIQGITVELETAFKSCGFLK